MSYLSPRFFYKITYHYTPTNSKIYYSICSVMMLLLRRWTPSDGTRDILSKRLINRHPVVVERRCLQNDSRRARKDGKRENVQKQPIQHHGHEFPILFHLNGHGDRITECVCISRTKLNNSSLPPTKSDLPWSSPRAASCAPR